MEKSLNCVKYEQADMPLLCYELIYWSVYISAMNRDD